MIPDQLCSMVVTSDLRDERRDKLGVYAYEQLRIVTSFVISCGSFKKVDKQLNLCFFHYKSIHFIDFLSVQSPSTVVTYKNLLLN
jgi:hypothetical protein